MLTNRLDELEITDKMKARQGQAYFNEVVLHTLVSVRGLYPSLKNFGVTEVLGKRGLSAETVNSLQRSGIGFGSLTGSPAMFDQRKAELKSVSNLGVQLADPTEKYPEGCPTEVALFPGTLMHHGLQYRRLLVNAARNSAWVTMAANWNIATHQAMTAPASAAGRELLDEFKRLYFIICGVCGVNPSQGGENPYLFGGLGIFADTNLLTFERPFGDYCEELREVGQAMLKSISEIPTFRRLAGELRYWLAQSAGKQILFFPPPLTVTLGFRVMPDSN